MSNVPNKQVDETFSAYPSNKVVGIIDRPAQLQAALTTLHAVGFDTDDVDMLCGQAGIERLDRTGKRHGMVAHLIRLVQFLGEEQTHLQQHEQALAAGHFLVAVTVGKDAAAKQRVRDVLRSHGGHDLHYYGQFTVEDL
jgi:hypothetical protein